MPMQKNRAGQNHTLRACSHQELQTAQQDRMFAFELHSDNFLIRAMEDIKKARA